MIKGTKSRDIIDIIEKIPLEERKKVKEVTLDMANNMQSAAKKCFPECSIVTDRFHVVKLVMDALQHIRIQARWDEIDKENKAIELAKKSNLKYSPIILENDDTPKQQLARSRYIIAKKPSQWTINQKERFKCLIKYYPNLYKVYKHTLKFRHIFEQQTKEQAYILINKWIEETKELGIKEFNSVVYSINYHLETILNFFDNRSTNAHAESFNSKIKLFRANLRGVVDTKFFLFRLEKLFA